jgi:hypothetical protein
MEGKLLVLRQESLVLRGTLLIHSLRL